MIKEKLRDIRIAKGYKQHELAEAIHTSIPNYCRKENGDTKITKAEWKKLADFLDVAEDEIYENDDKNIIINVENHSTGENFGNYNYYNNANEEMLAHILDYIKFLKKENDELKEKLEQK